MKNFWRGLSHSLILTAAIVALPSYADELQIAVAANFLGTLQKLAPQFEKSTGHKLLLSGGASGQFYTQIGQGAPFDIFLSADSERPKKLEDEGLAMPGSRFTYAVGKLVLWSPKAGVIDARGEVLKKGNYQFLSIANPKVAPYGAAAQQVLEKLNLWDKLNADKKIVTGESIAQALQFVTSGSADIAFVALAQVIGDGEKMAGSSWSPSQDLYDPITQDAVILKRTEHAAAAAQFMQWLRTDTDALAAIKAAGYTVK
jgi:molybdate transport system substrate-binding protein